MKKLFKISLFAIMAVVISACGQKSTQKANADTERVEPVEVITLEQQEISRQLDFSTTLQGYESMNISPSLTGNIEKIFVEVGTRVNQGQLLIRMDQNQLITSKINLASVKTELDRVTALKETGSATQQTYDQLKAQYDQLKQNVEFLETNTFVKAQFAGVISAKNFEDGEMYTGAPILALTQIKTLKALISIPEIYFPLIQKGMKLVLRSEIYPEKTFDCVIEIVYPTIDPATHTFQVKLKIPNSAEMLRPGMYVTTTLALGEADVLIAPYAAVLKLIGSNERYIFVNENGKAKRISVKMGQRFDENVEIMGDDIEEGMQLIVSGQGRLIDGVAVKVVNNQK